MSETTGIVSEQPPRYELLDYLRLIAALMVVLMHWLVNGIANGKVDSVGPNEWAIPWAKYGYLGVSLFFLISGFVITISTNGKSARQFVVSRFVRLYPAFWVALAFTSIVTIIVGGDKFTVGIKQFLANLTMVPKLLHAEPVDGAYWTLVLEVQFYVLILAVLFIGQGKRLVYLFPVWTMAMTLATVVAPHAAENHVYAGGYFFLFAAGALIATIRDRGPTWWTVVPLVAAWVMSLRFAMNEADDFLENKGTEIDSTAVGVIVTVFFLAVASMCIPRIAEIRLPFAQPFGALTYPVYLLHAHFGYMMLNEFATNSTKWLVYPILLASLLALAWALHWLVDLNPRLGVIKRVSDRTIGAAVERLQPPRFQREFSESRSH